MGRRLLPFYIEIQVCITGLFFNNVDIRVGKYGTQDKLSN